MDDTSTDDRDRRYSSSQLCEISAGRHFNYCDVCSAVRTGYVGGPGVYAKNKKDFLSKEFGIEEIPLKATFARVLSAIDGKEIGEAVLDILRMRFGASGEVIAVDGKAICSTSKPGNPHSALQILSAYMTDNGIVLAQETIHEKTNEIPVFQEMLT